MNKNVVIRQTVLFSPWPIVLDRPRCGFWKQRNSSHFINFLCGAGRWIPVWLRAWASGRLRGRQCERSAGAGETDVSCADYTCGASVMCRREEMMCGSSQKHTEAIPSVLHGLVQITSWSFTRIVITSTSSFLPRSRAASVRHRWMFIFITKDESTWWVHSSAQRPPPRQAVVFSPHKACQTGWMEERLQQASKPAELANYRPDVLQNPGIRAPRSEHLLLGPRCWFNRLPLCLNSPKRSAKVWIVAILILKILVCKNKTLVALRLLYLTHTSSSCWHTSQWLQEVEKKEKQCCVEN